MFYMSFTLFVIGVLVYDYYQYDFTLFIRVSNETALMERALTQIPICNSEDSSRQRALLYTLQAWTHLAHSHHLRYWISHQTLISHVQQHGLLPHDHEIDITIMAQDTPQLIELAKANFSSIYELKVHPQWFITKISNRSYYPSEGIDFIIYNARFVNHINNVSINIWPIYENYFKQTLLTEYDKYYKWKSIPEDWVFPLRPCSFSGIKLWCPAQSKTLFASMSGPASANTLSITCVNGSWIRSNI